MVGGVVAAAVPGGLLREIGSNSSMAAAMVTGGARAGEGARGEEVRK